jgi:hypothetical protein
MAATGGTLRVEGYQDFMRACAKADKDTKRAVRDTFRPVGDIVRVDAAAMLAPVSARSAAGFRTRVRQRGVAVVEQSIRKTTRQHPEFGALQMRRALLPSMQHNEQRVEKEFEKATDTVCDRLER